MLAYVLALAVGLGSLAMYLAAFFFPEIHRKNDFIWSGIGFFYALMLWVFAQRINGGLLLGHVASVALLGWFGWQTFSLRRQVTPQAQQTPVPSSEAVKTSIQQQVTKISLPERLAQLQQSVGSTLSGVKDRFQKTPKKAPATSKTTATSPATKVPPTVEIIDNTKPTAEQSTTETESQTSTIEQPVDEVATTTDTAPTTDNLPEVVPPNPPSPELVEAAQANSETENKEPIPVEEFAPDAVLAPPAEAPPEQTPPNNQAS